MVGKNAPRCNIVDFEIWEGVTSQGMKEPLGAGKGQEKLSRAYRKELSPVNPIDFGLIKIF